MDSQWEAASGRRDQQRALYYTGSAKWTSTLGNRLLLETGYSTNVEYLYIGYQSGIQKVCGSAGWFRRTGKGTS